MTHLIKILSALAFIALLFTMNEPASPARVQLLITLGILTTAFFAIAAIVLAVSQQLSGGAS